MWTVNNHVYWKITFAWQEKQGNLTPRWTNWKSNCDLFKPFSVNHFWSRMHKHFSRPYHWFCHWFCLPRKGLILPVVLKFIISISSLYHKCHTLLWKISITVCLDFSNWALMQDCFKQITRDIPPTSVWPVCIFTHRKYISPCRKWHNTRGALQWLHNERGGVSNHQIHDCLLKSLFRHRSQKASKLRVTGLCEGNSPVTGEFPAQRASSAENVSIWWRHHIGISMAAALDFLPDGVLGFIMIMRNIKSLRRLNLYSNKYWIITCHKTYD